MDKGQGFFRSVPDPIRTTYCHWGTVLFDHESETAALDLVRLWPEYRMQSSN